MKPDKTKTKIRTESYKESLAQLNTWREQQVWTHCVYIAWIVASVK